MLCLGKIDIVFHRLVKYATIDLLQRRICHKISLKIGLQEKFLIRVLRVEIRAEQIVQLICLQLFRSVQVHLVCDRAFRRYLVHLMHESRLFASGKIRVLYQFLVHQIELVHRCLLAQ